VVTVVTATVRDVSFVGAHMREADWRELRCQIPDNWDARDAALFCHESAMEDTRFVLTHEGTPAGVFGVSPTLNPALWSVWAFGTEDFTKVAPALTKHALRFMCTDFVEIYPRAKRLEVRSIYDHDVAHKWLKSMHARHDGDLYEYGKDGENFVLYSWTRRELLIMREKPWFPKQAEIDDVFLLNTGTPQAPSGSRTTVSA